jgi:MerR family transcriptional regulator/heat shock protein HspR
MANLKHISETKQIEDNRPVYTLGVAAQLAEIPAHSIRQYIDTGLLIPYKLESKRHLFSQYDISRLKLIRELIDENLLDGF